LIVSKAKKGDDAVRTFEIRIKTTKRALEDFAHTFEALKAGERVKSKKGVYFTSVKAARNLLTAERIRLLSLIHNQGPRSIYQLAKLSNRNPKNVYEDIKLLERYGILRTSLRTHASRTQRVSEVPYDEINLRIPLAAYSKSAAAAIRARLAQTGRTFGESARLVREDRQR